MKLNEMLSGDIGNLIFVLQILSILEEFSVFFFFAVQSCEVRIFLMTAIFQPFSERTMRDKVPRA